MRGMNLRGHSVGEALIFKGLFPSEKTSWEIEVLSWELGDSQWLVAGGCVWG